MIIISWCDVSVSNAIRVAELHMLNEIYYGAVIDVMRRTRALYHYTRTEEENRSACTAIADFFADKIQKIQNTLNSKLAGMTFDPFSFYVFYSDHKLTPLSTVTPAEVYKLISGMKAKSSPVDSIPTSIIKACLVVFSELVTHCPFMKGCFPDRFKWAQVTPLLIN